MRAGHPSKPKCAVVGQRGAMTIPFWKNFENDMPSASAPKETQAFSKLPSLLFANEWQAAGKRREKDEPPEMR